MGSRVWGPTCGGVGRVVVSSRHRRRRREGHPRSGGLLETPGGEGVTGGSTRTDRCYRSLGSSRTAGLDFPGSVSGLFPLRRHGRPVPVLGDIRGNPLRRSPTGTSTGWELGATEGDLGPPGNSQSLRVTDVSYRGTERGVGGCCRGWGRPTDPTVASAKRLTADTSHIRPRNLYLYSTRYIGHVLPASMNRPGPGHSYLSCRESDPGGPVSVPFGVMSRGTLVTPINKNDDSVTVLGS